MLRKIRRIAMPPYNIKDYSIILITLFCLILVPITVFYLQKQQEIRSRAEGITFFPVGSFDAGIPGPNELTTYINDIKPRDMDSLMMNNNPITNPLQQQMLTVADQNGLNYFVGPQSELYSQWWNNDSVTLTIEKAREIAQPLVALMKDHPSLKGYNLLDDAWGEPILKRNLMQQAFYELDPSRPVSYIGGQDEDRYDFSNNIQPRSVYLYSYPSGTGLLPCQFIRGDNGQRDWVDNFRIGIQSIPQNTPILQILQTHQTEKNINGVVLDPNSKTSLRYPTVEELRLQQWLAVGEGAKGLFWFTYNDLNDTDLTHFAWKGWRSNPSYTTEITDLSKRLIPLKPILVQVEKIDEKFDLTGSGKTYSSTFLNKTDNKLYVLVVNFECSSQTVTLSSKYLSGQLKNVEDQVVTNLNSPITLLGGDGKLFEIVNRTLVSPQPTPSPKINLVQNGSFESLDSNGKPLNWTAQATNIDKTVSRTGNNSLKMTGPTNELYFWNRPLLKPNTKYMMTAFVKSDNATSVGAIYVVENPGISGSFANARLTGTHDFKKVYSLFTTPSNFVDGRLDVRFTLPTNGTAWVDDVEVCEVSESCYPIPYTLLQNQIIVTPTPTPSVVQSIVNGVSYQNKAWTNQELNNFMTNLSDTVVTHHAKKSVLLPELKGMIYEWMKFNPDRAWEDKGWDTMHDGAWFGNVLASAYRATQNSYYSNILNQYPLTFYPNLLNNSDKYFVLNLPDGAGYVTSISEIPRPTSYPSNPVSKGIPDYLYDDGESRTFYGETPHIGYRTGAKYTSLHMQIDIANMLVSSIFLTNRSDVKLALKNLALGDKIAYGTESGGHPAVFTKLAALKLNPGDTELTSKLGSMPGITPSGSFTDPNNPPFGLSTTYKALYQNTSIQYGNHLDGPVWTYYQNLLDQDRKPLDDVFAKSILTNAYSNIVLNQLWYEKVNRQPGLNNFDGSLTTVSEKFSTYYSTDSNHVMGSRYGNQVMFFAASGLQLLKAFPSAWTKFRDTCCSSDLPVEIRWDEPQIDGVMDTIGYSPSHTIDTDTQIYFRSSLDTLFILIDRPTTKNISFTLYSKAEGTPVGATISIDGIGVVTAKGRNGTDDLIFTKQMKVQNNRDLIEIAVPYTVSKNQKPWANAVDDSRLSVKGANGVIKNMFFLSSSNTVKMILEKELVEGLRFWEYILTDWKMIPAGFYPLDGKNGLWSGNKSPDGFSDTGGYAGIINAASLYSQYLNNQNDWSLYKTVSVNLSPTPQIATPTPSPTTTQPTPTRTPTPTPTSIPPTSTPIPPTSTPVPNSTKFSLNVLLHGIGIGGDNANPTSTGNLTPLHPQKSISLELYDSSNTLVKTLTGTIAFSSTNGNFIGIIDGGTTISTGSYLVKLKSTPYLKRLIGGIVSVTSGQTTSLSQIALTVGDANSDNQLNILDYNLMLDCYSELSPPRNCDSQKLLVTDFNDDGTVNQFDYNLFLRELSIQIGQ